MRINTISRESKCSTDQQSGHIGGVGYAPRDPLLQELGGHGDQQYERQGRDAPCTGIQREPREPDTEEQPLK